MSAESPEVQALAGIARCRAMVRDWRIERWNGEYPPGHSEREQRMPADIRRLMAERELADGNRQVKGS